MSGNKGNFIDGFFELSLMKQVFFMVGIAGSIALGMYTFMWAKNPNYAPIFTHLSPKDTGEVVDVLQRNTIPYQIDAATGLVLVDATKIHEARIKLATEGVPQSISSGFEILDRESGFGTSQFVEQTRYLRGLQGELEKTIASIQYVKSARVHLAIPKSSSFVKNRKRPSASVFVDIYGGYELRSDQVAAISHLVGSSIQGLSAEHVTVIDQNGKLLSATGNDSISVAARHLSYTERLEAVYSRRVQDILEPILGAGKVRAEVTAIIDFTSYEETAEDFDPEKRVVRSEKTFNTNRVSGDLPEGVPGALSNQPTQSSTVTQSEETATLQTLNSQNQSTRNYEIDRKIKHRKSYPGKLEKLSVAVVVDDKVTYDKSGKANRTPLTEDELNKIDKLVKDAVGFNSERGDKVSIINQSFAQSAPTVELEPEKFYEKAWVQSLAKQGVGLLVVLMLIFIVLRPLLKSLANISAIKKKYSLQLEQKELEHQLANGGMLSSGGEGGNANPANPIERVRALIAQDPKVAAQVIKKWVGEDE